MSDSFRIAALAGGLLVSLVATLANAQTYSIVYSFGTLSNITGFHPVAPLIQGPDGTLYGTTSEGEYGYSVYGTVFKMQPDGSGFTVLKYFTNYMEAAGPQGGLVLDGDTLYGTTEGNAGAVFKVSTDGSRFAVLKQFGDNADGRFPYAGLVLSGTTLYGTTYGGGTFNLGNVFKISTDGSDFAVLWHLNTADGIYPYAPLVVSGSTIYGTTSGGGNNSKGTVFKLNTSGTGFTVLRHLATADGTHSQAGLVLSGNALYGTARQGGNDDYGTVFKLNTDGSGFTVLKHFRAGEGGYIPVSRLWLSGTTLYGTALAKFVSSGAVYKLQSNGSGFALIKEFGAPEEGLSPVADLWLSGATLYGTTWQGGGDDVGTIFKVNTDGNGFGVLKTFSFSREGMNPQGGLVVSGSTLYGTTLESAHGRYGTAYSVNTDGSGFTVLHSFEGITTADGAEPRAGLVLSGNTLFGTTAMGGEADEGTVFRVHTDGGDFSVLKSFTSGTWTDGFTPHGGLVCSSNTLYGTTVSGGAGYGSVFKINTNGSDFAVLKQFDGDVEGGAPESKLVLSGMMLYGTTIVGGSVGAGAIFKVNTDGSDFTVLKDYDGSDGYSPRAGMIISGDLLYGTTEGGGSMGYGTVFRMNTDGSDYTLLKEFDGFTEGASPTHGLALSGNTLYGVNYSGGSSNLGTVFKLNTDGNDFAVLKEFTGPEGSHPSGPLVLVDSVLYGTASYGGHLNAGVVFSLSLLPSLRLHLSPSNTVVLAWPFPSDGFALQQSTSLATANWTSVTNPPAQSGGEWLVNQLPSDGQRFYRLYKP